MRLASKDRQYSRNGWPSYSLPPSFKHLLCSVDILLFFLSRKESNNTQGLCSLLGIALFAQAAGCWMIHVVTKVENGVEEQAHAQSEGPLKVQDAHNQGCQSACQGIMRVSVHEG